MPLDSSIYGRIGQGVRSVADYDQQHAQAEASKQAQQMNALNLLMGNRRLAAEDRGIADQQALRQVVGGFGADDSANVQSLYRAGRLSEAQAYQKASLDAGKVRAETAKLTDEQARTKRHEAFQHISSMKSPEEAMASLATSKDVPEEARGPLMQALQKTIGNPAAFSQWQDETLLKVLTAKEMLDLLRNRGKDKVDAANKDILLSPDGVAVANKPLFAAKNEVPLAQLDESKRHNRTTEGLTAQGQRLVDARSRESNASGNLTIDSGRGLLVDRRTGDTKPIMAGGVPVGPKAGAGGSTKISAEVQRQIGGVVSFDKDLTALENALKDFDPRNPLDQGNTTKRARIQSLGKQAQLSAKEAAALGALSGPDMMLLEGILNDPTSMKGMVSGGKGIAAQISEARAGNRRRVDSLKAQYGDQPMAGVDAALNSQPKKPDAAATPGTFDGEKEKRYQEWKARQK